MDNNKLPTSRRGHLRQLIEGKQVGNEPLSAEDKAKGFRGWHERGYLPHCDKPGLTQFITIRLADSMPQSRRAEWEHLIAVSARNEASLLGAQSIALREQRQRLEDYLDRNHGECYLRNPLIAQFVESALLHGHDKTFQLLAWVVMPNHVHALLDVWQVPLARIMQNWKSIIPVHANKILQREDRFWQTDYWDTFMRSTEQERKAIRYIENNPVKARLCLAPEAWPFSSARFRNPQTCELEIPSK